jgi:hypothetical protein
MVILVSARHFSAGGCSRSNYLSGRCPMKPLPLPQSVTRYRRWNPEDMEEEVCGAWMAGFLGGRCHCGPGSTALSSQVGTCSTSYLPSPAGGQAGRGNRLPVAISLTLRSETATALSHLQTITPVPRKDSTAAAFVRPLDSAPSTTPHHFGSTAGFFDTRIATQRPFI